METTNVMAKSDGYFVTTTDFEKYQKLLKEMEDNTVLQYGSTNSIHLESIRGLFSSLEAASLFDPDLYIETVSDGGSNLYGTFVDDEGKTQNVLLRVCAKQSIEQFGGISGPALGRMPSELYADTLNNCFTSMAHQTRKFVALIRYGKLTALHSFSRKNEYVFMDPSKLVPIVTESLEDRFKTIRFIEGHIAHTGTSCTWSLPDAAYELNIKYQKALEDSQTYYNTSVMPGVRFDTSDTGNGSAAVRPVFQFSANRYIALTDRISVRHQKTDGEYGYEAFKTAVSRLYAKFDESMQAITDLSNISILYPENTIIRLCKRFHIAQKYGAAARDEIMRCNGGKMCTAFDVYMAMTACMEAAEEHGASRLTKNTLDDNIANIGKIRDWSDFDISGNVAW